MLIRETATDNAITGGDYSADQRFARRPIHTAPRKPYRHSHQSLSFVLHKRHFSLPHSMKREPSAFSAGYNFTVALNQLIGGVINLEETCRLTNT